MQFNDGESQNGDPGDIEEMLDDLALEQNNTLEIAKKDTTIFIIDCCEQMMKPFEDESKSEFEKIIESYTNFMMSKIIANTKDLVGLILYNINTKENSLNFDKMCVVKKLDEPSATSIKSAANVFKDYVQKYGIANQEVPLHQVLWLYGNQVRELDSSKHHLRLFLFTTDDCPHPIGDEKRELAINHARQLVSKNVQIQLFPIRKSKKCIFDIRKFYQQIISVDPEDLNNNTLDNSSRIMDLQSRLRQKQFKKRVLNRLLMKVGKDTEVGIKIYCLYNKAKKPLGKKLQATTNNPLKRVVKKMNKQGEVLYDEQVGTYYPLGGEKIKISKKDMNQIKSLQKPGITIIGFKPQHLIKPYHNIRTSYFLYPDEEHVSGSSQFFDALIKELSDTGMVAIVKIMPRNNQELRFAALFPQKQTYNEENHEQTAPGFNMVILPYADDIVNFAGTKTIVKPTPLSSPLVQVTKLLINNLTVQNFDLRDFENPSLQKFYSHLQAHALNEESVQERDDLLLPDTEGLKKFKDIIDLVNNAAKEEVQMKTQDRKCGDSDDQKAKKAKKEVKKEVKKQPQPEKKSKVNTTKKSNKSTADEVIQVKQEQNENTSLLRQVQAAIFQGDGHTLKVTQLRQYLKQKKLSDKGKKEELIDRIMVYISQINQI